MINIKKIIVTKVGSSTILNPDLTVDQTAINNIANNIIQLNKQGFWTILVSSGAIGLGAGILKVPVPSSDNLELEQTCASVGEIELILSWEKALKDFNISQLLVNHAVFNVGFTKENLHKTLIESLEMGIIPVINDNDSVSSAGIDSHFTDNDELAVKIAQCVNAKKLIILSDVHGLFKANSESEIIPVVEEIDEEILNLVIKTKPFGGMKNKLLAIKEAMENGIEVCLTYGKLENAILSSFEVDFKGTRFIKKPEKS